MFDFLQDCNIGFNFAFANEARNFSREVNNVLIEQRQKSNVSLSSLPVSIKLPVEKKADKTKESMFSIFKSAGDKVKNKKKVTKIEIGGPINYVHLSHVGIGNSFDVSLRKNIFSKL